MFINPVRNNIESDEAQSKGRISDGVNPYIFRNYDIRGVYPDHINEKIAFKIASVFADIYPEAKKLVLARDSRLGGASLLKSVKSALIKRGRKVFDIGLGPDPLFFFSIFHFNLDGGVMVSASHNPKEYNGLILTVGGKELIEKDLDRVKELVLTGASKSEEEDQETREENKPENSSFNPEKDYIEYVVKRIKLKKPLKIILDVGNGSLGFLPEKVFKKLGCEAVTLFPEPDGNFPNHLPDPYLDENLQAIKKEVLKRRADMGLAFDGDGDRVVLIDSRGRRVLEDYCLLLLAKEALKKHRGPVVHDMRVSLLFLEEMKKMGVKTYFSVCHHNAVIEKAQEVGAVFAGEVTTHYFFPKDYYLADDALFAGLKMAELVSQEEDFAKLVDSLPVIYASPEIFIEIPDERKFSLVDNLKRYLKENNFTFIDIDGVRIQFENGWALARASNTSPLIKLRFEGRTEKDLLKIQNQASKIFAQFGIIFSG